MISLFLLSWTPLLSLTDKGYAMKCLTYVHVGWFLLLSSFTPLTHVWAKDEINGAVSLDVRHTDSCDTLCQWLQWVGAFTDVVVFKEPCCSQNARVSQHNSVNVCLRVLTLMCVCILGLSKTHALQGNVFCHSGTNCDPLEQNTISLGGSAVVQFRAAMVINLEKL